MTLQSKIFDGSLAARMVVDADLYGCSDASVALAFFLKVVLWINNYLKRDITRERG